LKQAQSSRKFPHESADSRAKPANTPAELAATLRPFRASDLLPDYPLGSDFTPVEERLVRALAWLKSSTATVTGKIRIVATALASPGAADNEALKRMGLSAPATLADRLDARLLRLALNQTAT
jgi:hypothetical protein